MAEDKDEVDEDERLFFLAFPDGDEDEDEEETDASSVAAETEKLEEALAGSAKNGATEGKVASSGGFKAFSLAMTLETEALAWA